MFDWFETQKYNVGDRIRLTPDPYIWTGSRESGKIIKIDAGVYEIEWDDSTVSSLTEYFMSTRVEVVTRTVELEYGPAPCRHDMKTYLGLSESFNYCTMCDHREKTK